MGEVVVAVDPGPHTGLAVRDATGQLHLRMIHNDYPGVWKFITEQKPGVIVVEKFATAGVISRDGLQTVEMAGACYALAWVLGAQLHIQVPIARYPFLPAAKEIIGAKKHTQHHIDALAHLLCYEQRTAAAPAARGARSSAVKTAILRGTGRELPGHRGRVVDNPAHSSDQTSSSADDGVAESGT